MTCAAAAVVGGQPPAGTTDRHPAVPVGRDTRIRPQRSLPTAPQIALTDVLLLLVAGTLVTAGLCPAAAQEEPTDAWLCRNLGLMILVRYLAGAVLTVVLAAFILEPASRQIVEGPGALGVVAPLMAAAVMVLTTAAADALQRAEGG